MKNRLIQILKKMIQYYTRDIIIQILPLQNLAILVEIFRNYKQFLIKTKENKK